MTTHGDSLRLRKASAAQRPPPHQHTDDHDDDGGGEYGDNKNEEEEVYLERAKEFLSFEMEPLVVEGAEHDDDGGEYRSRGRRRPRWLQAITPSSSYIQSTYEQIRDTAATTLNTTTTTTTTASASPTTSMLPDAFSSTSSSSRPTYDIFISHAGEQRQSMAWLLYEELVRDNRDHHHGERTPFLDRACLAGDSGSWHDTDHVMQFCSLGIFILSPEYIAKEHSWEELQFFLQRRELEPSPPQLIFVFDEVSRQDCGLSKDDFFDKYRDVLDNPSFGFADRVAMGQTSETEIMQVLSQIQSSRDGVDNRGQGAYAMVQDTLRLIRGGRPAFLSSSSSFRRHGAWWCGVVGVLLVVGAIVGFVGTVLDTLVVPLTEPPTSQPTLPPAPTAPTMPPSWAPVQWTADEELVLQGGPDEQFFGSVMSMTADGRVVAVGMSYNKTDQVQIWEWQRVPWEQTTVVNNVTTTVTKGYNISWVPRGEALASQRINSMGMSDDGSVVVVGVVHGVDRYARAYRYDSATDTWALRGDDIAGVPFDPTSRWARTVVAVSGDGTTVALAASALANETDGYVQVYRYHPNDDDDADNDATAAAWIPWGPKIVGDDVTFAGQAMALSRDGTILATGTWRGGEDRDVYSRVYRYEAANGNWTQLGADLDTDAYTIALSADGYTVAIGSVWKTRADMKYEMRAVHSNTTHFPVRVQVLRYSDITQTWKLLGGKEQLDDEIVAITTYIMEVVLSADGSTLAVGMPEWVGLSGQVNTYRYKEQKDEWVKSGDPLWGSKRKATFGLAIDISADGSIVAVGSPFLGDPTSEEQGIVQLFERSYGGN